MTDEPAKPSEPQRAPWWSAAWLREGALLAAVAAGSFVWLASATLRWPGDVDEGFYAIAGELVARGRVPYRDFFYPQAPALPYLLAVPIKLFGASYVRLRLAMAACGAGAATLAAYAVRRETGSRVAGVTAAALLCTHELSWQWLPSVRPYGVSALCAVAALTLVSSPKRAPAPWACALAGALAALAPLSRLLMLPVVGAVIAAAALHGQRFAQARTLALAYLLWKIGWRPTPSTPREAAPYLLAGAVVLFAGRRPWRPLARASATLVGAAATAAAFCVPLYRASPQGFHFGNVGYHLLRTEDGPYTEWERATTTASALIGGGSYAHRSAAGAQFLLLLALGLAGLFAPASPLRSGALLAALGVFLLDLRPNPIHEHYFTPLAPLLALAAGAALGHLARGAEPAPSAPRPAPPSSHTPRARLLALARRALDDLAAQARAPRVALCVGALLAYLLAGRNSFDRKTVEGFFDPWNMSAFRADALDRAGAAVRSAAARNPGPVLAPWSGSAFGLADRLLPGFEDHFARDVAYRVNEPLRSQLRLRTHDDFVDVIARREPSVVVLDRITEGAAREGLRRLYLDHGYAPVATAPASVEVFVRQPLPAPP